MKDELYRLYRYILKLVLMIAPITSVVVTFFEEILNLNFNSNQIFSQIIFLGSQMLILFLRTSIISFMCVTIIFLILRICSFPVDRIDIEALENLSLKKQEKSANFSVIDCLFNAIGCLFLIWLLCFQPQWIASYEVLEGKLQMIEPLFQQSVLINYHPLIFMVYGIGIFYYLYKLMCGKWSVRLLFIQLIYKTIACLLFCSMILNQTLFNERFFTTLFSFSQKDWTVDWYVLSRVLMAISIINLVIEITKSYFNYRKQEELEYK